MDPAPSPFRCVKSGDRTLTVTRGFASPGQRILRAHIDPDIAARWLGTPDMPLVECRIDPRPGGRFSYVFATPDAGRRTVSGQFVDLTETRIRHEETYIPDSTGGPVQVTTEITAEGHHSLLTLSLRFPDRAARDTALASPLPQGIAAAYQRLDALLQD